MTLQKKCLIILASFFCLCVFGQKREFGVVGGLLNGGERLKSDTGAASSSDTGFYFGIHSKLSLSEQFNFSPEINYGNLNNNSFGFVSVMFDYYIVDRFYFQGGPQFSYIFDTLNSNLANGGFDLSFGLGYEINEKFDIQGRYSFELTNRSKFENQELTSRLRWINIGLSYSF